MAKRRPKKGWLQRLAPAFLVIGAGAVAYMVYRLGPRTIWSGLAQVGWGFAITCSIHMINLAFDAFMLRLCAGASGGRLPYRVVLTATLAGHAINEATPLNQLGELTKFNILDEKLPATKAAAALILQNLLRFIVNAVFLAVLPTIALLSLDLGRTLTLVLGGVSLLFVLAGAAAILLLKRGAGEWPFRLLRRLGLRPKRVDRLQAKWKKVEHAWQLAAGHRGKMVGAVAAGVIGRLCGAVEVAVILIFLDQPNAFLIAFLVQPNLLALGTLVSFVPMQVGVAEGGAYVLFRAAGMSPHVGVVMELVRKVRRLLFVAIGVTLIGLKSYRQMMTEREADGAESSAES